MKVARVVGIVVLALVCLGVAAAGGGVLVWRTLAQRAAQGEPPAAAGDPRPVEVGLGRQELPAARGSAAPALEDPHSAAVELNNRATRLLADDDLEGALELFEQAHGLEPANETFRHNTAETLARLALRERDAGTALEGALAHLERALELDPEREDLIRLAERWRDEAEVERGFWKDTSAHFELSYDGSRSDLAHGYQPLIDQLEDAYADLRDQFGNLDPVAAGRPPIRVVLYRKQNFDRLTGLGDWAGGVFDGTVRIPVEDLAAEAGRLGRVLRHELVHAFIREAGGGGVPGWLNEGLAQGLENGGLERISPVRLARARQRLAGRELFTLAQLEGSLATWTDTDDIHQAYAQSLALIDYVARTYGSEPLFEMVRGYAVGNPGDETFRRRCGVSLDVVLGDLRDEIAQR